MFPYSFDVLRPNYSHTTHLKTFYVRGCHSLWRNFPVPSIRVLRLKVAPHLRTSCLGDSVCPLPDSLALLTESIFFLLLRVLRYFNSPRMRASLFIMHNSAILGSMADMRLPQAFRSLPRPSSLLEPSHPLGGV